MHIFSKLGGCGSKIESATPLWNFNLKGAWQAQFLSHTLLILENCIVFEDKQMILVSFIKIRKGKKVINFGHSCHIHFWVIPGPSHFAISAIGSQNVTNKSCLVFVKSEKYAFWVTLRLWDPCGKGKAEPCTIYY